MRKWLPERPCFGIFRLKPDRLLVAFLLLLCIFGFALYFFIDADLLKIIFAIVLKSQRRVGAYPAEVLFFVASFGYALVCVLDKRFPDYA